MFATERCPSFAAIQQSAGQDIVARRSLLLVTTTMATTASVMNLPASSGPLPANCASQAQQLLQGTDSEADARWQQLADAALDQEVALYREGIEDMTRVLKGFGVEVSADDATDRDRTKTAGIPGVEVRAIRLVYILFLDGYILRMKACEAQTMQMQLHSSHTGDQSQYCGSCA